MYLVNTGDSSITKAKEDGHITKVHYIERTKNGGKTAIVYDNTYGHSEIKWSQMYKLYKSKHLFLIYMTKNQAIIIPKRIFESEQEMNETWELIQECYNKNREDIR